MLTTRIYDYVARRWITVPRALIATPKPAPGSRVTSGRAEPNPKTRNE